MFVNDDIDHKENVFTEWTAKQNHHRHINICLSTQFTEQKSIHSSQINKISS